MVGPLVRAATLTRRRFPHVGHVVGPSVSTGVMAPASSLARTAKTYVPISTGGVVQNLPLSCGAPYHTHGYHSLAAASVRR